MIITCFQALNIILDHYKFDNNIRSQIYSLYLSGVTNKSQQELLDNVLSNSCLKGFEIKYDHKEINNDPVRRYFESHLSMYTLKENLPNLNKYNLKDYFSYVFAFLSRDIRQCLQDTVFNPHFSNTSELGGASLEFHAIIKLIDEIFYTKISKDYNCKEKTFLLIKIMFASQILAIENNKQVPLNVYSDNNSIFGDNSRGRTPRQTNDNGLITKQNVMSNNLGIMRSFMPISQSDELYCNRKSIYTRPADASTYINDGRSYEMINRTFNTKILPFVNSISGTGLMLVRIMAYMNEKKFFIYKTNSDDFMNFIRCIISVMVYTSGGHSIHEFTEIFKIPEIQQFLEPYFNLNILEPINLFQNSNIAAFNKAVEKTIIYNNNIVNKIKLHFYLVNQKYLLKHPEINKDSLALKLKTELYNSTKIADNIKNAQLIIKDTSKSLQERTVANDYLMFISNLSYHEPQVLCDSIWYLQIVIYNGKLFYPNGTILNASSEYSNKHPFFIWDQNKSQLYIYNYVEDYKIITKKIIKNAGHEDFITGEININKGEIIKIKIKNEFFPKNYFKIAYFIQFLQHKNINFSTISLSYENELQQTTELSANNLFVSIKDSLITKLIEYNKSIDNYSRNFNRNYFFKAKDLLLGKCTTKNKLTISNKISKEIQDALAVLSTKPNNEIVLDIYSNLKKLIFSVNNDMNNTCLYKKGKLDIIIKEIIETIDIVPQVNC